MRLNELQAQVDQGEYRVNTLAVADAIIRRLMLEQQLGAGSKRDQDECS